MQQDPPSHVVNNVDMLCKDIKYTKRETKAMVNVGFTVERELWQRFRELCEYRRQSVSDTLHKIIEQWVWNIEIMKGDVTGK